MAPPDHRVLAAGGLVGLLGLNAYVHYLAGYRPPIPLQEPAMRLADRLGDYLARLADPAGRADAPADRAARPRTVQLHRKGVLSRQDFAAADGDLQRLGRLLAAAPRLRANPSLAVELHADEGKVTPMWWGPRRMLAIPAKVWGPKRVLVVPDRELLSTTVTVGAHRSVTALRLTGQAHSTTPEELCRLLAHTYGRLTPDEGEHAMAQLGLRPATPDGSGWLAQVLVCAWAGDPERAREIRNLVASMVCGVWAGDRGRWEPDRRAEQPAAQQRLQQAALRLHWLPSTP